MSKILGNYCPVCLNPREKCTCYEKAFKPLEKLQKKTITIKEHIENLISANAKHIAELTSEDEVKHWLNSLLWSVAGFKN